MVPGITRLLKAPRMAGLRRRLTRWLPVAAAAGFALVAYGYLTLPDVRPLATVNPATTAFIELRLAEARAAGRPPRRNQRWVRYERISPHLRRAVLVAEDSAFWQHDGVDLEQLKESIETNLERGQLARGASTITQQLAKNLYLSPARTPMRKLRELIIARRLEAELSKRRILELYLNVVEWGDGIYGAEAASRAYFRKPASRLSPSEAALLAGALVNARVLVPSHANARLLRRQRIILARMGSVTPPAPAAPRSDEPVPAVTKIERVDEPLAQQPAVAPASMEDTTTAPPR
jgi:monofunctional biosynthetic peptidoglycan transglycosylase